MTFVIQEGAGGCPPLGNVVSAVSLAAMRDSDYEDDKSIVASYPVRRESPRTAPLRWIPPWPIPLTLLG